MKVSAGLMMRPTASLTVVNCKEKREIQKDGKRVTVSDGKKGRREGVKEGKTQKKRM